MNTKQPQGMKQKHKGFTLVELLIAATVIALAISVILPIGQAIFGDSRADKELSGMQATMENIRKRYTKEPISSSLNNARMISSKLISTSFRVDEDADIIYSEFDNGLVTITGLDGNGLQWEESAVPTENCIDFIFGAEDYNWDNVAVDGRPLDYVDATQDEYDNLCGGIDTETVEVTFRIEPAS